MTDEPTSHNTEVEPTEDVEGHDAHEEMRLPQRPILHLAEANDTNDVDGDGNRL
jgi:hypothetical protein